MYIYIYSYDNTGDNNPARLEKVKCSACHTAWIGIVSSGVENKYAWVFMFANVL